MAGIKLEAFQGLIPRVSKRLLPPMAAQIARNTKILNGELRGFREPEIDPDCVPTLTPLGRVFRVPNSSGASSIPNPALAFITGYEGADGATSLTEQSPNAAVATFNGSAELDTAEFNSGASSLLLDGVDSYITFPDIADYDLGTQDWTIEGFVRFNTLPPLETSLGPGYVFFEMENGSGELLTYAVIQDGFGYRVRLSGDGFSEVGTISGGISTGVWYHWAMTRTGGNIRAYFNGNYEVGDFGAASADMGGPTLPITIGRSSDGADAYHDGWLDDMRFTKGTALYTGTGTYTIPTPPFDPNITGPVPIQCLEFDSRDVSVIRSPLINDQFDRYYWAGPSEGRPKMNTAARIASGDDPYILGVPTPVTAPGVTPPAGTDETRAYVYTFVSAFGEEGPPSPPTVVAGNIGTWNLASMDTSVPDASQRNITTKKIYRTVAGNASTSFFFVAEIPLAQSTYADNETSATVAANNLLESTTFIEPPTDMEGFVVMPNGYLVGWVGKRLLFSEPYRPHAWPAAFELSTEFNIVSLGVFGSTLVIGTESQPYFGQGVSPASFTTQKVDAIEPCLSRRGMVSMSVGVLYPSINGLILANSGGIQNVTQDLFTKEEWADYMPDQLFAAHLGLQYIAFNSANFGFIFDPQNPTSRFVELDAFTNVSGIETDWYSGNVLLLRNDQVFNWDPEQVTNVRVQWQWKSKTYQFPRPLNFGAARLNFDTGSQSQQLPVLTVLLPYNQELFGLAPALNTLNGGVLGGSPAQAIGLTVVNTPPNPEIRQPLGGSLLYPIQSLLFLNPSVRLIIYIRDKAIFDATITEEKVIRLPTGFKSDIWEIEMNGNTNVYSLQLAETPKGLAEV